MKLYNNTKGFIIAGKINKNKHAEVYYRTAINKELKRFIEKSIQKLETVYTPLKVNNKQISYNSTTSVNILLSAIKNKYSNIFFGNVEKIINKFVKIAYKNAKKSSLEQLIEATKSNILLPNITDKTFLKALKLIVRENVSLIKNTTMQATQNIESIVYNAMTNGRGFKDIYDSLKYQEHITADRIDRIARDQTAKTNEAINKISQQEAGIEYFEWDSVNDERTSTGFGGHKQLNGKIYKWNETELNRLPIIDNKGNRGYPTERVNCRCISRAVIILQGYEAIWDSKEESYKIIKVK